MKDLLVKTLSEIVTDNFQTATVFEKYGLDFCCKGKRPLQTVLEEKNIPGDVITAELALIISNQPNPVDFNSMSLTELAEYIVRVHHNYTKTNMPLILSYLQKVTTKHGHQLPGLIQVHELFTDLTDEMSQHMFKEEKILFPRIKQLELFEEMRMGTEMLQNPINVMKHEHDSAGNIMQKIKELTNNYTTDASACTTLKMTFAALKAFEVDLHQHVHLENNILFPKAIALSQKIMDNNPINL